MNRLSPFINLICLLIITGAVSNCTKRVTAPASAPSPEPVKPVEPSTADLGIGVASFYGAEFNGQKTSSGEIFHQNELTCAHKTLPFGTKVKVTNVQNGKSIICRVNDRGPHVKGRTIDLSKRAAQELSFVQKGESKVKLEQILR